MTRTTVSTQAGFNLFGAIGRGFAAWRQRRDRRLALVALLRMSPERLDDLGIDMLDVAEALHSHGSLARAQREKAATVAQDFGAGIAAPAN